MSLAPTTCSGGAWPASSASVQAMTAPPASAGSGWRVSSQSRQAGAGASSPVDIGIEGVGELGDDHVRQAVASARSASLALASSARQVAGGDRDLGIRVGDVVLELLGPVHRVDRHHDRVGAQDREMRDHQLRAVLHVEHHAVAALHAQRMQRAGQALGLAGQLAVAGLAAEEDQRGLVRIARGGGREVVPQRGGGHGDRTGQALGPELVMRAVHTGSLQRSWRAYDASGPTASGKPRRRHIGDSPKEAAGSRRRPTDAAPVMP